MRITVASSAPVLRTRDAPADPRLPLYEALSRAGVQVEIVALAPYESRPGRREASPTLAETRVPRSAHHEHTERTLRRDNPDFVPGHLLAMQQRLTPDFLTALDRAAATSSAVVALGVHAAAPAAMWTGAPLVLDARLAEPATDGIVARIRAGAALTLACSERQAAWAASALGVPAARIVVVPDGADTSEVRFAGAVGRGGGPVVVFAEEVSAALRRAAAALPDVRFEVDGLPTPPWSPTGLREMASVPPNVRAEPSPASGRALAATLGVARAAVLDRADDAPPRMAPQLLFAAAAGTPIVAGAVAQDLGLPVSGSYWLDDLAVTDATLAEARSLAIARTPAASAAGLLADPSFMALLERAAPPLRRKTRRKVLV